MPIKSLITAMAVLLAGCATTPVLQANHQPNAKIVNQSNPSQSSNQQSKASLQFDSSAYTPMQFVVNGQTIKVRVFENVVYAVNPLDKAHQSMNIYIPESYFHHEKVGAYSAQTAPIFMPALANISKRSVQSALAKGYVVVDVSSTHHHKVDLSAIVRYLQDLDTAMAGRADRIILDAFLLYGADEQAKSAVPDGIFAVYASNVPFHFADVKGVLAWQFADVASTSTDAKNQFINTLNQLQLFGDDKPLTLNADGDGAFKDLLIAQLNRAVNVAHRQGVDLSDQAFLSQTKSINPYYIDDFSAFLVDYVGVPTHKRQAIWLPLSALTDSSAQHWRIRTLVKDEPDLTTPLILTSALQKQGKAVDFAFKWNQGRAGDDDLDELFAWVDGVVATAK